MNKAFLRLSCHANQCILANIEHQRSGEAVYEFARRVQLAGIYSCYIGRSCGDCGYQVYAIVTGPDIKKGA